MKIIKRLAEQMNDELCGAKEYITLALEYKDFRPDLADTYYRMAQNEITHYENLHSHAVNIIQERKNKNISIPQKMLNK